MPDSVSSAVSVKVTVVEVVYSSPLLITIEPVGCAALVSRNTVDDSSKKAKATTTAALVFMLHLLYN
jgi:inorganic pyrophosphatase/exopolyphosphatase